jgi:hypothetical protein
MRLKRRFRAREVEKWRCVEWGVGRVEQPSQVVLGR